MLIITGTDIVTQTKNSMEEESFDKGWQALVITSRVSYIIFAAITIMSIKWHKLSEAIFYVGTIYLCHQALIGLPGNTDWNMNPSTKFLAMIFCNIDKALP